jgi:hypothetical protein
VSRTHYEYKRLPEAPNLARRLRKLAEQHDDDKAALAEADEAALRAIAQQLRERRDVSEDESLVRAEAKRRRQTTVGVTR